jgi:hypothetical protein
MVGSETVCKVVRDFYIIVWLESSDVGCLDVGRVDHRLGRLVGRDLGRRLIGWPVSRQASSRR